MLRAGLQPNGNAQGTPAQTCMRARARRSTSCPRKAYHEYKALGSIAFQAARWAGDQHLCMRTAGFLDVASKDQQKPRPEKRASPSSGKPAPEPLQALVQRTAGGQAPSTSTLVGTGHKLRAAEVLQDGVPEGHLLFCATCGSCAWTSLRSLRVPCRGAARRARAAQLRRIHAGAFQWHRPVLTWLQRLQVLRGSCGTCKRMQAQVYADARRMEDTCNSSKALQLR